MSQGKRYKFNGSTFKVQTALEAGKTVTGITAANPGVVSVSAHGYSLGDVVKLSSIQGMTQVNGNLYPVDNPASGTFETANDFSGYDAFATGSPSDGISQRVTFGAMCELTGVDQQDGGADEIEVSTICSTAKEFEQGLSDSGTLKLDFNYAPQTTIQAALQAAKISGDQLAFKITLPGDGGFVIMMGTVQSTSFSGSVNGVYTGSATIKLTGQVYALY